MISFQDFNQQEKTNIKDTLYKCCGSNKWVDTVAQQFPFATEEAFYNVIQKAWYEECAEADYLEAFTQHPKIGDVESLEKKFASTKEWAGNEQASVMTAQKATIEALAKANEDYEQQNGYIFIVCATGKSAEEMLRLVQLRLGHTRGEELQIAMAEQFKITLIRLKKAIDLKEPIWTKVSQITTHVLDTSIGKPGEGIAIKLRKQNKNNWETIALGITNNDGRIADLLPPNVELPAGEYEMYFLTGDYYKKQNVKGFYPAVGIHFETFDQTHYHVPLLVNPFGYSTYRGS